LVVPSSFRICYRGWVAHSVLSLSDLASYGIHYAPFLPNAADRCVPCTFGAIAQFFHPNLEEELSDEFLDAMCDYVEGRGATSVKALLALSQPKFGLEVLWIEAIGRRTMADLATPDGYKAFIRETIPDEAAYQHQLAVVDIESQCRKLGEYVARGLAFENRPGSIADIVGLIKRGYLVKIPIDSAHLLPPAQRAGTPPIPHSLLIVGEGQWRDPATGRLRPVLICHDAGGEHGNISYRPITCVDIARARAGYDKRRQIIALKPSAAWLADREAEAWRKIGRATSLDYPELWGDAEPRSAAEQYERDLSKHRLM
jgi:hypothetical protein